jgi:predicted SAM-dependent methyltransferase
MGGYALRSIYVFLSNSKFVRQVLRAGKPIRLDIGCGERPRTGYIGCDVRLLPAVQIVAPAWSIPFPPNSVETIFSRQMIEHLTLKEAIRTLRHWHVILRPGGQLDLNTPDLERTVEQLGLPGDSPYLKHHHISNTEHAMNSLFGWQSNTYDTHRWAYTYATLAQTLSACGFLRIERIEDAESSSGPLNLRVLARK